MKHVWRYMPGFVVGVILAQASIWACQKKTDIPVEAVTPQESVATVQPAESAVDPSVTATPTPTPTATPTANP